MARAKQRWPPALSIEKSWPEEYQALAIEQDFAVQDVMEAAEQVQMLIDRIAAE